MNYTQYIKTKVKNKNRVYVDLKKKKELNTSIFELCKLLLTLNLKV